MNEDHKLITPTILQFVARKMVHNTDTLDGKGTFSIGWVLLFF